MLRRSAFKAFALFWLATSVTAQASSLRVSPVLVDLPASAAAATLNLRNDGQTPLNIQARVFRWVQSNGTERLEQTDEVVASPPLATLRPKADYALRLVRVSKAPLRDEASYRVLVDELPDPAARRPGVVTLLVRQSIPIFFSGNTAGPPSVSWSAALRGRSLILTAKNAGDRRLRISALTVSANGQLLARNDGLLGYVLGRSTMRWTLPLRRAGGYRGPIDIIATSDSGAVRAKAMLGRSD
jgi:fimbrial chaperone protein